METPDLDNHALKKCAFWRQNAAVIANEPEIPALLTQCPTCEMRCLGERRCPDCHVFCRRLGLGGLCPHCDDPVTLAELLGSVEVVPIH